MSIVLDANSNSAGVQAAANATWNHVTAGTPDLIEVRCGLLSTTSALTFTATYGGVAMTSYAQQESDVGLFPLYNLIFYLKAPATGTKQIIVTPSLGVIWGTCGGTSWTGVDQTTPLVGGTTQIGSGTSDTLTYASTSGNVVVDTIMQDGSGITYTQGQTLDFKTTVDRDGAGQHAAGTGSNVSMAWTFSGSVNKCYHSAWELKAAAASGAKPWFWPHQQGNNS